MATVYPFSLGSLRNFSSISSSLNSFSSPHRINGRSYTSVLKEPFLSYSDPKEDRVGSWSDDNNLRVLCLRCRDRNHKARECREMIRCFRCGCFGHKRASCAKKRIECPKMTQIAKQADLFKVGNKN